MITMLKQFCEYNNWANLLLFDALAANAESLPESCISLFSHIINAQLIWSSRINGITPNVTVWELHDLDTCDKLLQKSIEMFAKIAYPETSDASMIKYTNSVGDHFETSLSDILLHVFNHGTYHRAQIAKEMKSYNIKPVNTDYIQFVRLKSS